jgi:hypothetical protein
MRTPRQRLHDYVYQAVQNGGEPTLARLHDPSQYDAILAVIGFVPGTWAWQKAHSAIASDLRWFENQRGKV